MMAWVGYARLVRHETPSWAASPERVITAEGPEMPWHEAAPHPDSAHYVEDCRVAVEIRTTPAMVGVGDFGPPPTCDEMADDKANGAMMTLAASRAVAVPVRIGRGCRFINDLVPGDRQGPDVLVRKGTANSWPLGSYTAMTASSRKAQTRPNASVRAMDAAPRRSDWKGESIRYGADWKRFRGYRESVGPRGDGKKAGAAAPSGG